MLSYDAILFDFDGVLADTEPLHWKCWRQVLLPLGVDLDWGSYQDHCIGHSDWDLLDYVCRRATPPLATEVAWSRRERKQQLFQQCILAQPAIRTETISLLASLCRTYKLAVVTSSDRLEVEPALVAAGVRSRFTALVTGNDVRNMKPDPEPYVLAANILGAQSPLVVEDSSAGETSGAAAGFDVLRVRDARSMPETLLSWLRLREKRLP